MPSYDKGINIIPRPKQLQELKLPAFRLTATTPVIASGDSAVTIARFFTEKINRSTGFSLRVVLVLRLLSRLSSFALILSSPLAMRAIR